MAEQEPLTTGRLDQLRELAEMSGPDSAIAHAVGEITRLRARVAELERQRDAVPGPDADAVTPCEGVPCEPGGEPCSRHEREESHADGEHELCTTAAGLREAADLIEADLIPTPIDEAEEHVNNVLRALGAWLIHLARR